LLPRRIDPVDDENPSGPGHRIAARSVTRSRVGFGSDEQVFRLLICERVLLALRTLAKESWQ